MMLTIKIIRTLVFGFLMIRSGWDFRAGPSRELLFDVSIPIILSNPQSRPTAKSRLGESKTKKKNLRESSNSYYLLYIIFAEINSFH